MDEDEFSIRGGWSPGGTGWLAVGRLEPQGQEGWLWGPRITPWLWKSGRL